MSGRGSSVSGDRTIQAIRRIARLLGVFTVLILVMGGVAGAGLFAWGMSEFKAEGPRALAGPKTVVVLPRGTGLKAIAVRLDQAGVITNARIFEIAIRLSGDGAALKAGEFSIPSRMSMAGVAEILKSGKSLMHKFTVAEGLTSKQIVRLLAEDPILIGDVARTPAEGTLLPETYSFPRGTTRDEVLGHMADAMTRVLVPLWNDRADGLPYDSMQDAVTLASIVEKETGIASERPRIAAVFVNRLDRGIRLQSDPTIIYGLNGGEPLGRGIRRSELDRKTDYNTYHIDGLPPTPIGNPGLEALKAVLDPPSTNELFFVADGTGGHVFASTNREHQRNVARWRKVERERR